VQELVLFGVRCLVPRGTERQPPDETARCIGLMAGGRRRKWLWRGCCLLLGGTAAQWRRGRCSGSVARV
jgi:hypothetical protein